MGYAVGGPDQHRRFIGYGVPAKCEHPDCDKDIDRGLAYACGDGVMGEDNCGLYFCGEHLPHFREDDDPDGGGVWVCDRCHARQPSFDPKPDTAEWVSHMLTDDSWAQWRSENPERLDAMRAQVSA